ncbi:MAG TPA: response regulator [Chitinophagales bacterium]|nr:response regulator [Chitinophagales bacterium]
MKTPVHVFLADDDADDRVLFYEAIRQTMPHAGMTLANNGFELIELLNNTGTTLPRLVFLDLNMPIKNGHECLAEIRVTETLKNLPVVIYSTSEDPRDIEKAYVQGADFYIHKPNSFNDLLEIVRTVLSFNRTTHMPPVKERFVLKSTTPA